MFEPSKTIGIESPETGEIHWHDVTPDQTVGSLMGSLGFVDSTLYHDGHALPLDHLFGGGEGPLFPEETADYQPYRLGPSDP